MAMSFNAQGTTFFGMPNNINNGFMAGLSTGPHTHYGLGEIDFKGSLATGMVGTAWAFVTTFFSDRRKTFNIAAAYNEFEVAHQGDNYYGPFLWDAYGLNSTQAVFVDTKVAGPKPLKWIDNTHTLGQDIIPEIIHRPRPIQVEEFPFCSRHTRIAKAAEEEAKYLKLLKKIGVPSVVATPSVIPRDVSSLAQSITAPAIASDNVFQTTLLDFAALNIVGVEHNVVPPPRNSPRLFHAAAAGLLNSIYAIIDFHLANQPSNLFIIVNFLAAFWTLYNLMVSHVDKNGEDKDERKHSPLAGTLAATPSTPSGYSGAKPPRRRRNRKRSKKDSNDQ